MDVDRQVPEDLSSDFLLRKAAREKSTDVSEMEAFLQNSREGTQAPPTDPRATAAPAPRPLPQPKPLRAKTEDTVGRLPTPEDQKGGVMRNVAEIPSAAVGGVEAAIQHAVGWAIDPLANWLNENVADLSYNRPDPKTPTGAVTKSLTEFLTGFVPAIKGLRAAGLTGNFIAPTAAAAFAGFATQDPSSARLADLWKKADLPSNILTDYLAHPVKTDGVDAKESELESRFKNALEQAGFGVAAEGVLQGARAIKAIRGVKGVKEAEEAVLKEKYGTISDQEFNKILGDPSKPSIEMVMHEPPKAGAKIIQGLEDTEKLSPRSVIRSKGRAQAATAAVKDEAGNIITPAKPAVQLPDFDVYVNFGKMDTPDQIKFAIGKMAEAGKSNIDEATRGTITHVETQKLADDLGMTVTDLLARRKGQPLNAEEAVAARQLWVASGERLVELAKTAAGKNAGPLDQFAFRKQMAVHSAIQSEVIGARTETARALSSWNIPVKGDIARARAIDQVLEAMGGPEQSSQMARRLAILAETNANPEAIAKFAEKGALATTVDALKEAWINGLLSNPKTHVVNMMSNTMVAAASIAERQAAGVVNKIVGGEGVQMGEAAAMTYGMVTSVREAWQMAAKAVRTGETSWTLNKMDLPQVHAISAEAYGMAHDTGLGRFLDFVGTATRVPTRLLGAEDEFFKTIGYRMELHAQSLRQGISEGLSGETLGRRMAEIVQNPPEHIMINSADAALYQTFTNEVGWFGKWIMEGRAKGGSFNPLILVLPFVRTPVNITRYALERTPFAPLVGQWRADIAAGGARADLALAKMATGTSLFLTVMDFADKGYITGPGFRGGKDTGTQEAQERQGVKPFSAKLGDRWVSYDRADPFGMVMGFAAAITEAVKKGEVDQDQVDEWQEVAAMSIAAISQVVINKTYLQGAAKMVETLSDPKRYAQKYIDDLVASFLPATALMSATKNFVDPIQREVNNPVEAVYARIAGLSEQLSPRRDLWGKPVTNESGQGRAYDFLTPFASKKEEPTAIDREMVRTGHGYDRINKQSNFDGVQANMRFYPKVYDDYVRLSGNDLKHPAWGMGAKDYLNAVVSGKHPMSAAYNVLSDESRKDFIQNTIQEYRKLAQQQILSDPQHAAFSTEIARLKEIKQGSKMPVLGE